MQGILYVLDEPSVGLHQRDNQRLLATLTGIRDLGNTVVVVEHDEETIRAADWILDLGEGAGRQGGRLMYQGPPGSIDGSLTGRYLRRELSIPVPADAPRRQGGAAHQGGARAQPARHRRRDPPRRVHRGDGRERIGQVDPGGRHPVPRAGAAALRRRRRARTPPGPGRRGGHRQGGRHRPEPDRPHAALQPRDLRRRLHVHPRPVLPGAGSARPRLQARALLLQREGRPLRSLPGRRRARDPHALPARRVRALRGLPRPPLQPRDARSPVPRAQHRRRAGPHRRRGPARPACAPAPLPHPLDAGRRRARLHPPRPERGHPVRRGGAARQAGPRAGATGDGPHPVHPRRAHHRSPPRRRLEAAPRPRPARGGRQYGGRDRAQPGGREDRGPRHRPRAGSGRGRRAAWWPRGRRRRWRGRVDRTPAGSCAGSCARPAPLWPSRDATKTTTRLPPSPHEHGRPGRRKRAPRPPPRVPHPREDDLPGQPFAGGDAARRRHPARGVRAPVGHAGRARLGRGLVGDARHRRQRRRSHHRSAAGLGGDASERVDLPVRAPVLLRPVRTAQQDRVRGPELSLRDVRVRGPPGPGRARRAPSPARTG